MGKPDEFDRRGFFTAAGGAAGYSLYVFAGPGSARGEEPRRPDAIRASFESLAPEDPQQIAARFDGEPNMTLVELECDLLVAGGGLAGVCAALAAARNGTKVVLVQDRSRLGGNSSSEVKMHVVGANNHGGRPGWREGGILEELRLDDAVNNPQRCWELWDLLLYDKLVSELNCTLLLETTLYAAEVDGGRIQRVMARCDKSEQLYRITAGYFADCTGDGRLALEAGAATRWGHEAKSEFGESLAWDEPSRETLGSSILFTARRHEQLMPYRAPRWARQIGPEQLRFRGTGSWEYGYWWIEWGGREDTIRDNERIRFELLSIVTGVWNYIKNSGRFPNAENWALEWVGMLPGKRESRRIEGDVILTQQDLERGGRHFDDAVAIGGWGLDEHPPGGFDDTDKPPFKSTRLPGVYNIPLRALYSRNIENLFMAGRNASCSHVAFTSTRVMATCAVMGQAVGTAAALCAGHQATPRAVYENKEWLTELQQRLLRDDQTILCAAGADPADLARQATATASGTHETATPPQVLDGEVRDLPGAWDHRWAAPLVEGAPPPWIELAWEPPRRIGSVQLTFDSGFHRELTLSASDGVTKRVIRAPQPETVKAYTLSVQTPDGAWREVASETENHQRLRRHALEPVEAARLRVTIQATHGSEQARVFEIRCYGD